VHYLDNKVFDSVQPFPSK